MTIAELMEFLRNADPSAAVMLVPPGDREQYAEEVRFISSSSVGWTRESGIDKGRPYEFLYPGAPHRDLRAGCEQVTYESVSVVLLKAVEATVL
ncbi:hypothetical protein A6V36_20755 [Paraburkholderia ginsengiterrae]|uniref:Uncharacterized protein n=1 Tax=Paraburkholderia ginsengiterrae TaxID=1462993 RepID=A0A1A9NDX0_9BURK|nr:hypothetical protein [Paraburkholderia ginsengiterrae]OAJ62798.1 hypothetical protein A6V36_20755 [Paraburkholderia ginsengiterrae]OAJ64459.1 hypothetical protein A6V37_19780 [Paraburkholderia ginsengiterrae]